MSKDLLIRKPIEQLMKEASNTRELKRVLGPLNLTTLGIGAIIGAGIFVLTGQAAARYAGPAIVFSFIFSGFGAAMAALCYAEFASTVPISGSAYTYAYATLGELFAWIIGWDLMLEYLFGASTVAVGWSGYVVSFLEDFGITIPSYLSSAPLRQDPILGWQTTGAFLNLPAMFIVAAMTVLLVIGIRESAVFNNTVVLVKISVLLLFIIFGIAYIKTGNWVPFIPPNTGEFGHFGLSGILRGAGVIFFAYFGFDAVSTAAQEARDPKKDMPIGIISSLAVSTILYIAVSLVLTGLIKYDRLLVPDPIAIAVNAAGPGLFWLRPFVKIGAIAGLSSVVLVLLLSQPRIFYTMAKDGLLPKRFSSIHPRFKTPYVTTILTGIIAIFVSGILPIEILGALVSIGTLLAFAIVCTSVLILRRTQPDLPRPFKTPLVPWVPVFGALFSFAQMIALPVDTWLRLIIWMAIGLIIYFSYGRKHSKVRLQAAKQVFK
jgi:APA family basic amino acid/polyamine antiporter